MEVEEAAPVQEPAWRSRRKPARSRARTTWFAVKAAAAAAQVETAAAIEITTGRRTSPGCESRWLGMAAGL